MATITTENSRRSKEPKEKNKNILLSFIILIILGLIFIASHMYFKNKFFINVKGTSMEKTLNNGDLVLLKKTPLQKNRIAIFTLPDKWEEGATQGKGEELIKRVVATEGDRFNIKNKLIKVNGKTIFNLKNMSCENHKDYSIKVPKDYFIAFGDNYKVSLDSRRQYCIGESNNILIKTSSIVNIGKIVGKL